MTPDPRLRARRLALVILVWAFFGILGGLSFVAEQFDAVFQQLNMTRLPAPTEGFLVLARFVRSPLGFGLCTLPAVGISVFILQGGADRRLKALTITVILGTILFSGLFVLSVYLPVVKIQQRLSS